MSEQLYIEEKLDNVPLSVTEFTNIDDSASHGDQADKSVPHPNDNEYYEESKNDEDEDHYNNEEEYNIPRTIEDWKIVFEARYAESKKNSMSTWMIAPPN